MPTRNVPNSEQGRLFESVAEVVKAGPINLSITLTATSTHAQAMKAIDGVCGALHSQETSIEHTRRVLGKTLAVIQDHKLHEPEFTSFEQFSQSLATRHRISRATLRDTLFIARRLPDLTDQQVEAIPMVSLTLLARAAKDAKPGEVKALISDASRMPINEFRASVVNRGLLPTSSNVQDIDTAKITFNVSTEVYKRWTKLVGERDATTVFIDAVNMLYREMQLEKRPMSNTKASRAKVVTKVA